MHANRMFRTAKGVLFLVVSSPYDVLIRGVPLIVATH